MTITTKKQAQAIIHSLSKTSKMNCFSYGFSASNCITGAKLMKKRTQYVVLVMHVKAVINSHLMK